MTTVITPDTPEAVPAAHRNLPYLRYVAGQTVSILGDQVWYVALSWAAVQLASPAVAGLVLTVSAVPRLVLMLFGGAFVDRLGPKRLMIGSDLLRAVVSATAAAVALATPSIGLLIVMAVIFGVVSAVFMPAAGAMAPMLLHKQQMSSGAAIAELTSRAALTLGAPLGGVLVAVGGLTLAAGFDAATFALSALALMTLRPRTVETERQTDLLRSMRDGFGYLRRNRLVLTIVVIGLLDNLGFVGPMNVGLALLSDERGWGAGGIGAALSGFGAGAMVSAAVLLRTAPRGTVRLSIVVCTVLGGVGILVLALVPTLWMAVVASFVIGLCSGLKGVSLRSLSQLHTDDAFRGRVSSISTVGNLGVTPLMIAVTGVAVDRFGLLTTFAASASLCLAAGVIGLLSRALRTARAA